MSLPSHGWLERPCPRRSCVMTRNPWDARKKAWFSQLSELSGQTWLSVTMGPSFAPQSLKYRLTPSRVRITSPVWPVDDICPVVPGPDCLLAADATVVVKVATIPPISRFRRFASGETCPKSLVMAQVQKLFDPEMGGIGLHTRRVIRITTTRLLAQLSAAKRR